jgi:tetratricopeptide (TPR) repeat protein
MVTAAQFDKIINRDQTHPDDGSVSSATHASTAVADIEHLEKQAREAGDDPETIFKLANLYKAQGQTTLAADLYRRLLKLSPAHPEVSLNYGNLLQKEARYEQAILVYQNALAIDPGHTLLLNGLGNTYCQIGAHEKALPPLKKATRANPNDAVSWFNLANVNFQLDRVDRAQKCLNRAKKIRPKKLEFFHLAGEIEEQLSHWSIALETYTQALDIDPNNPITLHKLGRCYIENDLLSEAEQTLERCLQIMPEYPLALYHLGNARRRLGKLQSARQAYQSCLAQSEDHPDAELNLALCELQLGHWQTGWQHYEARWKFPLYAKNRYPLALPQWAGQPLSGKSIALSGEQGIGDEIMLVRIANTLAHDAKKVVVYCNPRLENLFQRSLPNVAVQPKVDQAKDLRHPKGIDYHTPLASALQFLPPESYLTPFYLKSDPLFKLALPKQRGQLAVGISWHSKNDKNGKQRTLPLQQWKSLLCSQTHCWVNLQSGSHQRALRNLNKEGVTLFRSETCNPLGDLDPFAALIHALDLVITIDNSTAHLAASLGIPTWVLLPRESEWRWGTDTKRCAWYDTVRLYRADEHGWGSALEAVRKDLIDFKQKRDFT